MESWQWLKDFSGPRGYVVRVNILPIYEPKYSLEIGVMTGGVIRRHLPGDIDPEDVQKIYELFNDAIFFVSEQKEARAKMIATQAEEARQKELAKRQRHSQNLESRREQNRAASKSNGGGKKQKS